LVAERIEPAAAAFSKKLNDEGFFFNQLVNILPDRGVIYVAVPKVASTRIRSTLGKIAGRYSRQINPRRWGRRRPPQVPRSMSVRTFYRLATDPDTLRFSFVRNPYARLVSSWAHIFKDRPLVAGSAEIVDGYLAQRENIDKTLPAGADKTLSFEQFTIFAAANANSRFDQHVHNQDDIVSMPGIDLTFIGRIESFNADFIRVLDHLGASDEIRRETFVPLNPSEHEYWTDYYTADLADRIYRAYERDFDRFGYPRALPG
ncbi:MAG: sulfotransferase family 2 domain-containing protein, partial [Candidatus Saccharimonadales bacterium]